MRKCADNKKPLTTTTSARFGVACIATCTGNDLAFVFLRAEDGAHFVLEMDKVEAWMVGVLLSRHLKTGRQFTHQAMAAIIEELGGAMHQIVIERDDQINYRAMLQISKSDRRVPIRARASDGLALALAARVPLHVDVELISINTWRAARSPALDELSRVSSRGREAPGSEQPYNTALQQAVPQDLKCAVQRCADAGEFRIFQYREDARRVDLVLCERHARPILDRYKRECAGASVSAREAGAATFVVACVATRDASDMAAVYLRGDDGQCFLFTSGTLEAWMLLRLCTPPDRAGRPLTHESILATIEGLGGLVREVVIHSLRNDAYCAAVELVQNNLPNQLDVSVADGVALAVASGVPLRVASELIWENGDRAARRDIIDEIKRAAPMLVPGEVR